MLRTVQDPDLHKDIVALEFVKDVKISGGEVDFTIELTTPACPVRDEMKAEAEAKVAALPGVTAARAKMTASVRARGGFGRQAIAGDPQHRGRGRGQGGRRQVHDLGQPGRRAPAQGRARGPHGRRRLRPQHPPDARDHGPARGQRRQEDDPARGPRHQGHLDGHAGAPRPGRHLARSHASRRRAAVHARRRSGASSTTWSWTCRRARATSP